MEESVWLSTLTEVSRQISGQQGQTGEPWPQQQWFECFKILVYDISKTDVPTKDDLIFFVALDGKNVTTRRRTQEPPSFQDSVDWKSTVAMYIMIHTEYHCTMSVCETNETIVHGNACMALPHVSRDTVVFEIQDLMPPLHLEHMAVEIAILFNVKADIVSSWIPKSSRRGDAVETILSSGKVTMDQLKSVMRSPSFFHAIVQAVIPSTDETSIELTDPMQTVVYKVSMTTGLSADVMRLCTMHVVDLERFSTFLFQSLYRELSDCKT
jgi:hypothetical protein